MIDFSKVKQKSLTRLMVCFKESTTPQYFYSFDTKANFERGNAVPGMNGLLKRILEKYKDRWHTAIIYSNKPPFEELATYKNGEKIR